MVRTKALTDAEIASGVGRTKPIASKAVLEQSRSGPGSRGFTVVNSTDNKNYIIPKALVRELSRTWDQVLAAKDTSFMTIDDGHLNVQFVLEWMKCGGCDNPAPNALQYPAGSEKKLECLGRLAGRLGIDELVKRVKSDLEIIRKTAFEAQETKAARQAEQERKSTRVKANARNKRGSQRENESLRSCVPQPAGEPSPAAQPRTKEEPPLKRNAPSDRRPQPQGELTRRGKPRGEKGQAKKRSCQKCGDPRHSQNKCPVGWSEATDGAWKFIPRKVQAYAANADGKTRIDPASNITPAAGIIPVGGKTTTRPRPEPLEHTAGDIDNFQLVDESGKTWFVPWYKMKVRFETVPGSGKVGMIGDAPLEYSWIPAPPAENLGSDGARLDSDSSHKA